MALPADELLQRPVTVRGIVLGRPVDLILAAANGRRVLGLDVLCGDREHRFLPIAAATLDGGRIEISSTLALLDEVELAYYRERGSTLRSLRGRAVARRGRPLGILKDVSLAADGSIHAVVLETSRGPIEVAYEPELELPSPLPPVS